MPRAAALLLPLAVSLSAQQTSPAADQNPYLRLMLAARDHARAHGATASPALSPNPVLSPVLSPVPSPVLSPIDRSVLDGSVPLQALHQAGFRVVPWTTNDPAKMLELIHLGVDGIISDRPDLLHEVVVEARRSTFLSDTSRQRLAAFDISAHRGGRGLRPENTLPAFESGLDNGSTSIETDTGVTSDRKSLLWHDQFLSPESCRRSDGKPYSLENRVYIRDISMAEAQHTFVCDKLRRSAVSNPFPDQRNDIALSPVSIAFARQEGLRSIYVPTHAAQLFEFVRFYSDFYRTGLGRTDPHATERALTAENVRFNLETKILPDHLPTAAVNPGDPKPPVAIDANHTADPQTFVDTLTHAITAAHMQSRAQIQSFDFRTLSLVEEQHPGIPTYYLIEDVRVLSSEFVPASLRQPPQP